MHIRNALLRLSAWASRTASILLTTIWTSIEQSMRHEKYKIQFEKIVNRTTFNPYPSMCSIFQTINMHVGPRPSWNGLIHLCVNSSIFMISAMYGIYMRTIFCVHHTILPVTAHTRKAKQAIHWIARTHSIHSRSPNYMIFFYLHISLHGLFHDRRQNFRQKLDFNFRLVDWLLTTHKFSICKFSAKSKTVVMIALLYVQNWNEETDVRNSWYRFS